jgi:hypothetical protein
MLGLIYAPLFWSTQRREANPRNLMAPLESKNLDGDCALHRLTSDMRSIVVRWI